MIKLFFSIFFSIVFLFSTTYGQGDSISCNFKASCGVNESPVFYSHALLSSNVRILSEGANLNYPNTLCCSSPIVNLDFNTVLATNSCLGEQFMYFTDKSNARTAYSYNPLFDKYKMCVKTTTSFTDIDILAVDKTELNKYLAADYSCLYRTSDVINGHMSSCESTFGLGNFYDYTVVGRVFDTQDAISCNSDCTSDLDNRIFSVCKNKIKACSLMPNACEGSLVGAWVRVNTTHEIKCQVPWETYRVASFTQEGVKVETKTGECNNLINVEYTIIVNGEQVKMKIYSCQN